jgi:hypothetical protein
LTTRLVLPLITLPPVILVPGHRPSQEVKCSPRVRIVVASIECGAASGTSSCSLSQTGYWPGGCEPPSRFTNVDDVTQNHANPRAVRTTATSVFRGAAFHLATTRDAKVSEARVAAARRLLR